MFRFRYKIVNDLNQGDNTYNNNNNNNNNVGRDSVVCVTTCLTWSRCGTYLGCSQRDGALKF
jgi:hypothetical protein